MKRLTIKLINRGKFVHEVSELEQINKWIFMGTRIKRIDELGYVTIRDSIRPIKINADKIMSKYLSKVLKSENYRIEMGHKDCLD